MNHFRSSSTNGNWTKQQKDKQKGNTKRKFNKNNSKIKL
jgi:hypothetical protein